MKIKFDENTAIEINMPPVCSLAAFLKLSEKVKTASKLWQQNTVVKRQIHLHMTDTEARKFLNEYSYAKRTRTLPLLANRMRLTVKQLHQKKWYLHNIRNL